VAQVSKGARGEIRVDEAWVVADCGMVVNADRVRSQSAMMHGAITMKGGGSDQG
jgi:CO/xanthine dehydrogenase Mo-binding subunit